MGRISPLWSVFWMVGVLLLPAGCRSPRPTSLTQWNACLKSGQSIHLKAPLRKGGTSIVEYTSSTKTSVLHLSTQWGKSPFVSEYSFAFLSLELPRSLKKGQTLLWNSKRRGLYREGGQILVYEALQFKGKLTVLALTKTKATVQLDLQTHKPTKNILGRKKLELKGKMELKIRRGKDSC